MTFPLDIPDISPSRLADSVLVAQFARTLDRMNASEKAVGIPFSVRFYAEKAHRASSSSAARTLKRLRDPSPTSDGAGNSPWLQLVGRPSGSEPHYYTLGDAAKPNLADWVRFGDQLYGPMGVLRTLVDRPCFAQGYLGVGGCVVLGTVSFLEPISRPDLVAALTGLLGRVAVYNQTAALVSNGLIIEVGDRRIPAPNQRQLLDAYEIKAGLPERDGKLRKVHDSDRIAYSRKVGMDQFVRDLREERCSICFKRIPGAMHADHHPPLHWGAIDEPEFLHPTCREHNLGISAEIRATEGEFFRRPHGVKFKYPGEDPERFFADVNDFNHLCMHSSQFGVADLKQSSLQVMGFINGLKGYGRGVSWENTTTGETFCVPENKRPVPYNKHSKRREY